MGEKYLDAKSLGLEQVSAVCDTNVLMSLEHINFLHKFIEQGNKLIIPMTTIQEIDKHAHCTDDHRKFQARNGLRFIRDHESEIEFDLNIKCAKGLDASMNDSLIITSAINKKAKLITLDMAMKLIAKKFKVDCIDVNLSGDDVSYKGYRIIELDTLEQSDNELYATLYNYKENTLCLTINEYVIIRDKSCPTYDSDTELFAGFKTLDILKFDGEKLVKLKLPLKKIIDPMNDLQKCALDLLNDKSTPIRIVCGCYGSGKSFLTTRSSLHQVKDKGNYGKVVLIRNNDLAGKDVGALPGTLEEKTDILFQSITQHFPMGKEDLIKMRNEGMLETYVSYFIKGADIGGYVIVDEAQDLTFKDIKKIGSRINEDGCINFVGDWNQTEGKYVSTSGLIDFIHKTKGNPLVGVIVLDLDVRSDTSKVFADLV